MSKTFAEHLDPNSGPKNILSLDGGGIRGALTLGYLKRIEEILRDKSGNQKLVLSDHFDLIGGTSTGSIIASGLALGMEVQAIIDLYMDLGGKIFGEKRDWWKPWETWKFLQAEYDSDALDTSLSNAFPGYTIGSPEIKTGLCIVAKRADTNSTWPLINHPNGKYFNSENGKNKDIPLWKAVRASSAAPTYFTPQLIDVGNAQKAAFVDGGVSMANNPALTLLMVATTKGFPFRWKMGADNLTVVSVGTGYSIFKKLVGDIEKAWMKTWATNVPDMLMQDASWQTQTMMQWFSESPTAFSIDGELGSLAGDLINDKPAIKYLRYNLAMTKENLNNLNIGRTFDDIQLADIIEMSNAYNRYDLYKIGAAAAKDIKESHFS
jgi:uncharacterized protein